MPIEVRLPELAESMSSATLTAWLKDVGDHVTEGEPIAEVETDKTTVELEAPASGVIEAIEVSAGTADVAVGAVLALLRERPAGGVPLARERRTEPAPTPVSELPAAGPQPSRAVARSPADDSPPSAAGPPAGGLAPGIASAGEVPFSGDERTHERTPDPVAPAAREVAASPLARRMAELAGLDLGAIGGTGAGGRVGKADVQRALRAAPAAPSAATPNAAAPGSATPGAEAPAPALPAGPHHDEPLTAARRVTAARMAQSKQTAPHFYLEVDCRVDRVLERLRAARAPVAGTGGADASDGADTRGGAHSRATPPAAGGADAGDPAFDLTLTDLLVRAVALALARVPLANSAWAGDAVRVFETADVAVAVATPVGLVTPVVRDAGTKTLAAVAAELRDLTARARAGRLQPSEYGGGTFTISNLGMYGVSRLYPILNPPQSCILGIGAVESRPVVRDGVVAAGRTMAVTLSADHRAIDGATGATFLRELRAIIEHPDPIFE